MRISRDVILRIERLGDGQRACLTQVNKFNIHFHNNYKYLVKLSLLTDMNRDHVVRLKLASIKSVPDDSNSAYTEYNGAASPYCTRVESTCLCSPQMTHLAERLHIKGIII
jgi:hypothetical protein